MSTILVTGASGTIGRSVLEQLVSRETSGSVDRSVRAFVRAAPADPLPAVDYRMGNYGDPDSVERALDGVDTVYLACGNVPEQVAYETMIIDKAATCGVTRVVKLSAHGAAADAPVAFWRWHAEIERHLASTGIEHVLLRPHFLMSNLLGAIHTASSTGAIFAPAGDASVVMVDPRDVADVAVAVLTAPTTAGLDAEALTVTGRDSVGFDRVASALTPVVGREVAYVDVPAAAAREQMLQSGVPELIANELIAVFAALRDGAQTETTDVVPRLTGHGPTALEAYLARLVPVGAAV